MRNSAFTAQIWFLSAELILSILLLGATGTYIAFRPQLWSPFNGLAAYAGLTVLYTATYTTVLCVTQISWFTSMVADAMFQGILCAGGPVCLGFAINTTLEEMESLDKVNINAAVVIFLGLALALIQWFHLWIKVILVIAKCGFSWTVWKQSFCNLMDRNQPRDLLDDFLIVNALDDDQLSGKRLSETEPIYGDAFDERAIETPPRLSTSTVVGDRDWLRSKYSTSEKSPAATTPAVQYDPYPCTTMDFDVPVVETDKPGSPIYTLPAAHGSHRYSNENLTALPSDENLPSARYAPDSRRQSTTSFDSFSPRNSGEYPRPSYDIYRSNSGNSYRLVDASRPPSLDLHRVDAAVPPPVRPVRTPSQHAQRPAFDLYHEPEESELSHEPSSTLYDHSTLYDPAPSNYDHIPVSYEPAPIAYDPTPAVYDSAPATYEHAPASYNQLYDQPQYDQSQYDQSQYDQPAGGYATYNSYDPTQSARYAEPPSSRYDMPRYESPAPTPRYDPPSSRYESPAPPRGSRSRPRSDHSHSRPKSYHGHSHPPVARAKSYVGSPYDNTSPAPRGPPPARSKSYGHGRTHETQNHQPSHPVRRYSQDGHGPDASGLNGRRWSQSSYTSLPRVPSMLRHSEVSDSAVE